MTKPISPVIVTFKALPGIRLQAIEKGQCTACALHNEKGLGACESDFNPKGGCLRYERDYIWREVPPKEPK